MNMQIQLTNEPIAHQDMVENCRSKSAGAVVLFLGTVREITGNEQTLFLEYEAFAPLQKIIQKFLSLLILFYHLWHHS